MSCDEVYELLMGEKIHVKVVRLKANLHDFELLKVLVLSQFSSHISLPFPSSCEWLTAKFIIQQWRATARRVTKGICTILPSGVKRELKNNLLLVIASLIHCIYSSPCEDLSLCLWKMSRNNHKCRIKGLRFRQLRSGAWVWMALGLADEFRAGFKEIKILFIDWWCHFKLISMAGDLSLRLIRDVKYWWGFLWWIKKWFLKREIIFYCQKNAYNS